MFRASEVADTVVDGVIRGLCNVGGLLHDTGMGIWHVVEVTAEDTVWVEGFKGLDVIGGCAAGIAGAGNLARLVPHPVGKGLVVGAACVGGGLARAATHE